MAIKKSELYSSLWASCDELRGGMDASQYKDYVLVLLFVKYISDRYAGQPYAPITIPEGASFADMVALKGKPDIGDQINKKVLGPLALANNLSEMPDFNDPAKLGDGKERVERLTNLIAIFENQALDFSKNRADGDDLLGDAYEYLMRHFATESGKSKGQFYTPAEVSRVIAQILGIRHAKISNDTSVYDPTCGSGSLLLKIGDEARHGGKDVKVSLYGQEKDNATAGLARMNMILHDYATADIKQGNTIANPLFLEGDALKTFDYVVANPPFSDKRWSTGLDPENDTWQRFEHYGIPPKKQGDYAYLLHIVRSLKSVGKGVCVLPHGVLFRGGGEGAIRRNLVQRGYIKGIIGLPANLFYGTSIPACLVVVDKEGASGRRGIFMIDASKGFIKDGNKNRLREQDIHKIVDAFTRQAELPRYSRLVSVAEISGEKNGYNLNLARYIDSGEPEDIQDIDAHLRGGIPNGDIDALNRYWKILPSVRSLLFGKADRDGYSVLKLPIREVKPGIFGHPEFAAFNAVITKLLDKWEQANVPRLKGFGEDGHPKAFIETISESLLATFKVAPLLDPYTVYQRLMDYWSATMQDDAYLIADDGWIGAAQPKLIIDDKNSKSKSKPDFVIGKKKYQAELIPSVLIIRRWFADEQADVDKLQAELEALQQRMKEIEDEQGVEDGLLIEAANNKGKYTKASVSARIKDIKNDNDVAEEMATLKHYVGLLDIETVTEAKLAATQEGLMQKVVEKYSTLTEREVISLVVDDKWLATLKTAVHSELDRVSQTLADRVRQLADRYAMPLPRITKRVVELAARVDEHLERMGAVCDIQKTGMEQLLTGETRLRGFSSEWPVKTLGELFNFGGGYAASRDQLSTEGYCYLHYGDIHTSTKNVVDVEAEYEDIPKLNVPLKRISSRSLLKDGDVVFVDASEDDPGVSKHVVIVNKANIPFISGLHTIVAKAKTDELADNYRRYCFQTQAVQEQFLFYAVGTKVTGISKTNIAKLTIPVPSIAEQNAIADVLLDMDAELRELDRRHEKTRALRQGMMQALLTGKTRLI